MQPTQKSQFQLNQVSSSYKKRNTADIIVESSEYSEEEIDFFKDDHMLMRRYPSIEAKTPYALRTLHILATELNTFFFRYIPEKHVEPIEPINLSNLDQRPPVATITTITPLLKAKMLLDLATRNSYQIRPIPVPKFYQENYEYFKKKLAPQLREQRKQCEIEHLNFIKYLFEEQEIINKNCYTENILILLPELALNTIGLQNLKIKNILFDEYLVILLIKAYLIIAPNKEEIIEIIIDFKQFNMQELFSLAKQIQTDRKIHFHDITDLTNLKQRLDANISKKQKKTYKPNPNELEFDKKKKSLQEFTKQWKEDVDYMRFYIDTRSEIKHDTKLAGQEVLTKFTLSTTEQFFIDLYFKKAKLGIIQPHEIESLKVCTKLIACMFVHSKDYLKDEIKLEEANEFKEIYYLMALEKNGLQNKVVFKYGYRDLIPLEPVIEMPSLLSSIQLMFLSLKKNPKANLMVPIKQDITNFTVVMRNLYLKTIADKVFYYPAVAIITYLEMIFLYKKNPPQNNPIATNDIVLFSQIPEQLFCGLMLEQILYNYNTSSFLSMKKVLLSVVPAIFMSLDSAGEEVYQARFRFYINFCKACHENLMNIEARTPEKTVDAILEISQQLFSMIWPSNTSFEQIPPDYHVSCDGVLHDGYEEYIAELHANTQRTIQQ